MTDIYGVGQGENDDTVDTLWHAILTVVVMSALWVFFVCWALGLFHLRGNA